MELSSKLLCNNNIKNTKNVNKKDYIIDGCISALG